MTDCRICDDDVDLGFAFDLEFPTDEGHHCRLAGQLCVDCADWLALAVLVEQPDQRALTVGD